MDNDHIFALIILEKSGYISWVIIIQKVMSFAEQNQKADGSWGESFGMTAAAIQTLDSHFALPELNSALGQATRYLKSTEQSDAEWGNVDSTG